MKLQNVKIGGSLARYVRFGAPTVSRLESLVFPWLRRVYGGSCKTCPFCHVANCENGRKSRTKCWFFLHPRVWSRVAGFPVASPCLWGKLENLSYSNVSKQVVMPFCVAGMALCDIPTCLIMCRKYQNWRKPRTKCLFCCAHVSRLESLVFLAVSMGEVTKSLLFEGFQASCPSRFAWQTLHFETFQPV